MVIRVEFQMEKQRAALFSYRVSAADRSGIDKLDGQTAKSREPV